MMAGLVSTLFAIGHHLLILCLLIGRENGGYFGINLSLAGFHLLFTGLHFFGLGLNFLILHLLHLGLCLLCLLAVD